MIVRKHLINTKEVAKMRKYEKGSEFKPGNFKDFFDQLKIKYISKTKDVTGNEDYEKELAIHE